MKILKVKCLAPTRLDNYLTQQYPALTPGRLNKALRENKIKLNGKKQPLATRVQNGDEIRLFILDDVLDGAEGAVDGVIDGAKDVTDGVANGVDDLVGGGSTAGTPAA